MAALSPTLMQCALESAVHLACQFGNDKYFMFEFADSLLCVAVRFYKIFSLNVHTFLDNIIVAYFVKKKGKQRKKLTLSLKKCKIYFMQFVIYIYIYMQQEELYLKT